VEFHWGALTQLTANETPHQLNHRQMITNLNTPAISRIKGENTQKPYSLANAVCVALIRAKIRAKKNLMYVYF
jgi:hypothetical protein